MPFDMTSTEMLHDTDSPYIVERREDATDNASVGSSGNIETQPHRLDEIYRARYTSTQELSIVDVREHFVVLQNWEGVVTSVSGDFFTANIRRSDDTVDLPEDEVEIDIDNVPDGDQELIVPGGIFYLTVGTQRRPGSKPDKVSRVVFRRMPRWGKRDLQRADVAAESLWHKLAEDQDTAMTVTKIRA